MRRAAWETRARPPRAHRWMPWAVAGLTTSALAMGGAALWLQSGLPIPDSAPTPEIAEVADIAEVAEIAERTVEPEPEPEPERETTPEPTEPLQASDSYPEPDNVAAPALSMEGATAPAPPPPSPPDPYRRMAALWDRPPPDPWDDYCAWAERHQLRCLQGGLELSQLQRFGLPAILTLVEEGEEFPLLVLRMDRDSALIDIGDQQANLVEIGELTALWTGRSLLLWQPPVEAELIGPNSSGEAVRWLREQLARADGGSAAEPLSDQFDGELQQQVRRFQADHGLIADGLVGTHTLIVLSQLAGDQHRPSGPYRVVPENVLHP